MTASNSVIHGWYDGSEGLGQRWNGTKTKLGFPSQAGYSLWHVVPDFLQLPVLNGILHEFARTPDAEKPGDATAVHAAIASLGKDG